MKTMPFSKLISRQLIWVSLISFAIAALMTLVASFFILYDAAHSKVEKLEKIIEEQLDENLSTGWTPENYKKIYSHLLQISPDDQFYMLKGPQFREQPLEELIPRSLAPLLYKVEQTKQHQSPVSLLEGYVTGGVPIFFKPKCLACHTSDIRAGDYAGTFIFKSQISTLNFSITSILLFILIFAISYIVTAHIYLKRVFDANISKPILHLLQRIETLRLEQDEGAWEAIAQPVEEMALIESEIATQVHKLQYINQKMDALLVTEHETGLFHKDRFREAMKYELYLSEHYQYPLGIVVLKLMSVHGDVDEEAQTKAEKITIFANNLSLLVRNSDMAFRITDQLFAIILPETDFESVKVVVAHLKQHFDVPIANGDLPKLEFSVKMGYSSYPEDGINANELNVQAMDRLKKDINGA